MTVIEIPDEQAEALKAKAAAEGLTLEAWLERLAEERPVPGSPSVLAAAARIRELQKHVKPDPEGWTSRDYIKFGRR